MGTDIEIVSADIARVALAVRRLGADRKIVNNMAKEIRKAVPPIRSAIRENAVAYLPARNGLGQWVAKGRVTARVRRSAKTAGVSIVDGRNSSGQRSDLRAIEAGRLRHPTYGHVPWSLQPVKPHFASDAVAGDGADAFREATAVAVGNAIREVGL